MNECNEITTYEESRNFFTCFRLIFDLNAQFGIRENEYNFMNRVFEIWNNPEAYSEIKEFLEE